MSNGTRTVASNFPYAVMSESSELYFKNITGSKREKTFLKKSELPSTGKQHFPGLISGLSSALSVVYIAESKISLSQWLQALYGLAKSILDTPPILK